MSEPDPKACMLPPGKIGWNELMTTDTDAAGRFYSDLFGWTTQPFPGAEGMPYTIFKQDGAEMGVGGMLKSPMPGCPAMWLPYVVVADADLALAKAVELGAIPLTPVKEIPDVGRIAVIRDPQGATLGLHQMAPM